MIMVNEHGLRFSPRARVSHQPGTLFSGLHASKRCAVEQRRMRDDSTRPFIMFRGLAIG